MTRPRRRDSPAQILGGECQYNTDRIRVKNNESVSLRMSVVTMAELWGGQPNYARPRRDLYASVRAPGFGSEIEVTS